MRKLLLISVFICIAVSSYSQFKAKFVFCELVGEVNFSGKITLWVDFGDNESYQKQSILVDDNGKAIDFISMVDALNFMGMHGWEFVQAYTISHTNSSVYHFLFKKPYEELSEENKKLYLWK